MPAAIQDIHDVAPPLASVPDTELQPFLDRALSKVGGACWEEPCLTTAQALYAAHLYTITPKAGASAAAVTGAGPVTSLKTDTVSVTYAGPVSASLARRFYESSPYGLQYLMMIDTNPCLSLPFTVPC